MVYAVQSIENVVPDDDVVAHLTERGANSPNFLLVPNASRITEILITVGADLTADTLEGCATGIHMWGSCGEQWLGGPCITAAGAAATSAGNHVSKGQRYLCNIPVKAGEQIWVDGWMYGVDIGELHMMVTVVYDGPVKGNATKFDMREENLAAANTPVALAARGGAAAGDIQVTGGQIVDVYVNVGVTPVAGPLASPTLFIVTGAGLNNQNNVLEFAGPSVTVQDDVAISGQANINDAVHYKTAIPLKSGTLHVEAQEIEDDVGTPNAIITFGFL